MSERVIEVPKLFEFVDRHLTEIKTVLDVGCCNSVYLQRLKHRGLIVDGIDVKSEETCKKEYGDTFKGELLRNYFVGRTIENKLWQYDLVICLSTLEHAGIIPYKVPDYEEEQYLLFKKIVEISKKYLYVSFPYGVLYTDNKIYANITRERLEKYLKLLKDTKYRLEFYQGDSWSLISQKKADTLKGGSNVNCVCILYVQR